MSDAPPLRDLSPDDLGRLATLSTISELLNASYDLDEVLQRVMDVVIDTLGAQRGFVMVDRGGDEPEVAMARGLSSEELEAEEFRYSRSIVQHVLRDGEPVLSHDASEDARFSASRSIHLMGTRSIMCVPMRTRSRNLGLIYLDNQTLSGLFADTDLELLKIIADLAAAAIERAHYFGHLVQNEKLAALGTLVAGIAHELNNPLTSIMGLAQLIRERLPADSEDRAMAGRIHQQSLRCRNLVRELLSLSRREKAPRCTISVRELVEGAARLAATEFRQKDVELAVEVGDELPPLEVNADQLTQVLLNLLTNALHAVRGRPGARVQARALGQDGKVRIVVSDNGPGIPPQHLRQIFDPFFTTKPAGEGTGLGLSISMSIVAEHGGLLQAHNDRQGGAVVTVELPARPQAIAAEEPK